MGTKKTAVKAVKVPPSLRDAYEPKPTRMSLESEYKRYGGWNPEAKVFKPIRFAALQNKTVVESPFCAASYTLDCIAFAAEAGALDRKKFVEQVFAKRSDFEAFCEEMPEGELYWINDRHHYAVLWLVDDEGAALTYPILGEALYQAYAEEAE